MTEPSLTSQVLGIAAIFFGMFLLLVFTAKHDQEAKVEVEAETQKDFYAIARANLKNSDRKFTFDAQPPVGLK